MIELLASLIIADGRLVPNYIEVGTYNDSQGVKICQKKAADYLFWKEGQNTPYSHGKPYFTTRSIRGGKYKCYAITYDHSSRFTPPNNGHPQGDPHGTGSRV